MASRVSQILDALSTTLAELAPSLNLARGRAQLREHAALPRCVFVRTLDEPEDPVRGPSLERTCSSLSVTIEAHVIAEGDEAEDYQHLVIAAAHDLAIGSFELGDSVWTLPDNSIAGELVVIELRFKVPVLAASAVRTQGVDLLTVTHDTGEGTPGDGVLECDEP